jgi:hypothetical protein
MQLQRNGDSFIMDDAAHLPGIKPIDLVHVQRVQLFLGVTTKADISTSDSVTLCNWAIDASANPCKPTLLFPRQERPRSSLVLDTWRRVIRLCYSQSSSRWLDQPLGTWRKGHIQQIWNTVIHNPTGIIHSWRDGMV